MNLLALLERTAPVVPSGIGRVHSSEKHDGSESPEEAPKVHNMIAKFASNRAKVLKAICGGTTTAADIQHTTGICRSSVFNHVKELAADGLVSIKKGRWKNTYTPTKAGKAAAEAMNHPSPTTRSTS